MRSVRARTSRCSLSFEQLENRLPLSAAHGSLVSATHLDPVKKHVGSSVPYGLTPDATRAYYGFDQVSFGGTAADGAGQTIAIVTARNNPNVASDLAQFDQTFGLAPPPSFRVVNQTGRTKLPKNNKSWGSETALDVEWAHAIAPGANILVVEAKSDSLANFAAAIDFARNAPGVSVVSVSAAGDEFKSEALVDSLFTTPPGHPGVSFVFASGDDGGTAEYPSSSPNVLSVGGTSLNLSWPPQWQGETVWSDGGGGASQYEGVPSYQNGLGLTSRGTPDVSYNADPYTGFAVLDTYGNRGWAQFGGTSAGTPQWAALLAIVNQGRTLSGKTPLANAQAALYAMPSADFHDIVYGDNQSSSATVGYDLASGLGSPIADLLIPDMVAFSGSTDFTVGPAPVVATHGKSKHHFSTGVDVATAPTASISLNSDGHGLHRLMASSLDAAYAEEQRFALVDAVPVVASNGVATRTSSKTRLGSATRERKLSTKPASDVAKSIDAFFDGLGEDIAAA
jgi:subtilase family serine protease